MNIDQPDTDGSSDSADGDNATTPPDSPPPPRQPEEEVEEATGAAEPSFTAMPALADVGEEGEDLRYSLYISLMHGYNVGLRYIDEQLAAPPPPPPPVAEEQIEQVEEGSTPSEEIPYEQIEERSDELPYEQMAEGQPEEEVADEDTAAVNMAVDAAIRAVASDTSLAREGEEKSEPEPPPEDGQEATKVTVHMYHTEETRTIGSPPSYRRPESPRAANSANSKGSAWNYASSSVNIVLFRAAGFKYFFETA